MSYNILNFPSVEPGRIDTLKTIVSHVKPDIFMVCELRTAAGSDNILFNALNTGGVTSYAAANFVDGPDSDNCLYYNSDKLVLVEQNEISTALRDINEYVLYHKATDLASAGDTVFFYIYVCHLKASSGFEAERNAEATEMKNYIASRTHRENVMIGGDFNLYGSSTEPAWNTILNGAGVTIKDPIVTPGEWHNNAGFAPVHTQSTRIDNLPDGGSTGGMDDRFDFIFISPDLQSFGNGAKYVSGSYKAVGQDALHFNKALIDAPTNTSEPWNIITALYHMSDHLPVYMEIEVATENVGVDHFENDNFFYYNKTDQTIRFKTTSDFQLNTSAGIFDFGGKEVRRFDEVRSEMSLDVSDLDSGLYVFKTADDRFSLKFSR